MSIEEGAQLLVITIPKIAEKNKDMGFFSLFYTIKAHEN